MAKMGSSKDPFRNAGEIIVFSHLGKKTQTQDFFRAALLTTQILNLASSVRPFCILRWFQTSSFIGVLKLPHIFFRGSPASAKSQKKRSKNTWN